MSPSRPAHLTLVDRVAVDDATLISRVKAGDTACAEELVRRAGPRAKAAVRRLLRQPTADDDDLTQLVLIELVTTIDTFRGECSLNTWVDRLAAHTVYKRLRRQKLERRLFDGLGEEAEQVASSHSSERRALADNLIQRVKARLGHLDFEKVSAWLLFDVHGFTLEELAHTFESSVAAVQSRVSRARKEVRACLENDPELMDTLSTWEFV
ncbi:MAG: RNA polymerase sigma factor [Myxococcaceae bacterium]|nr:RNA polymerase sigma factor [Myxococcaceae bacterium]